MFSTADSVLVSCGCVIMFFSVDVENKLIDDIYQPPVVCLVVLLYSVC